MNIFKSFICCIFRWQGYGKTKIEQGGWKASKKQLGRRGETIQNESFCDNTEKNIVDMS